MTPRRRRRDRTPALVTLVVGVLALVVSGAPVGAQDDIDRLEGLEAERERIAEEAAATAEQVDMASATVDEVAAALDGINAFVELQEGRLGDARRALQSARDAVSAAGVAHAEVEGEMSALRDRITELAVSSFTGEGGAAASDMTGLVLAGDPGEVARFRHLLELQTGSLSDGLDRLRTLELEAQRLIGVREEAASDAAAGLAVVARRSDALEDAQERQAVLVTAAETRLEARLAEAAVLEERDAAVAAAIRDEQQAINRRIATVARANGVAIPRPVDLEDIVAVRFPDHRPDFSIDVHVDIAEATEALFIAAFESGLDLTGFGYRPIQHQIELRAANCGGTTEDIWHKPVSQCAPPTARPGFSRHERGLAIDFFSGGTAITAGSHAFSWLSTHAPRHGFVNLEGEPWHWSSR